MEKRGVEGEAMEEGSDKKRRHRLKRAEGRR